MAAPGVLTYAILRSTELNKSFLSDKWGRLWQSVPGAMWDTEMNRTDWARRSRWPDWAPSDALLYIGSERNLERVQIMGQSAGTLENEGIYRTRLRNAWTIWQIAGSAVAHTNAFGWTGLLNTTVVRRHEAGSPPSPYDGPAVSAYVRAFQRNVWAQFDLLAQRPHPWSAVHWGDGRKWGDGSWTWSSTATPYEIAQLRRLAQRFKSGHSTATYVVAQIEASPVWGLFTWGAGPSWGGVSVRWLVGEQHWRARGIA